MPRKRLGMVCEPDSQLQVRIGMEEKAARVWATASRAHQNLDFGLTSQPLAAAITEYEAIGGTAWPNVILDDDRLDYAFTLWSNSTFGLLSFWWHSNRQHPGRARITIRSAESLPILDLRALSDEQPSRRQSHIRRLPRQGTQARLPRRCRPQPRPSGPARGLRPPRLRRGRLSGRPPPGRQVVRRAVRTWRQAPAPGSAAGNLKAIWPCFAKCHAVG